MIWQPIDTAPIDQRVLVLADNRVQIAYYDQDVWASKPRPYWRIEAYRRTLDSRHALITHWMPLPDLPVKADAKFEARAV